MPQGAPRFWLLEDGRSSGPFAVAELVARAGFGPQSLVCLEGKPPGDRRNWRPARRVKDLSGFFPEPKPAAARAGEASADEDRGPFPVPARAAVPAEPRRTEAGAAKAWMSRHADIFQRFNPVFAGLAVATVLLCLPIALLSKRPARFKDPLAQAPAGSSRPGSAPAPERLLAPTGDSGAPFNVCPRPVEAPAAAAGRTNLPATIQAGSSWLRALPEAAQAEVAAVRAGDAWQRCLEARRFADCAAACRKSPSCGVPDAWEVCRGWTRSDESCLELCAESGQCKPPADVLNRRCRGLPEADAPPSCRAFADR